MIRILDFLFSNSNKSNQPRLNMSEGSLGVGIFTLGTISVSAVTPYFTSSVI
jgi:hypothetical protein